MNTTFKQQAAVLQKLYNAGKLNLKTGELVMEGSFCVADIQILNDAASTIAALALNAAVMSRVERFARLFSVRLRKCIGKRNLRKVIDLNNDEPDSSVCHSHDFCDANVVMIETLEANGLDWEKESNLLDAAWSLAKKQNFYI